MKRIVIFSFCILSLTAFSAIAQITISTNNYQPAPSTTLNFHDDITMDATFFNSLMTSTGGPINWDFSSRVYSPGFPQSSYDPISTPAIDSFPTGNLVIFSIVGVDSSWLVYNSAASAFTHLGSIYHGSGIELVTPFYDFNDEFTFPLAYNDQWTSYHHTRTNAGLTYTINFDTSFYNVDAWGTIQYQSNSFPCLRVNCERTVTINTYDNLDNLIVSNTQLITTLLFIADGFERMVGATKVTFIGSDSYSSSVTGEFINLTTDVELVEAGVLPDQFMLSQNYPNPFNPSTTISLSVPTKTHVSLVVYDILGREVATLINNQLSVGTYEIEWDGKNNNGYQLASGVYLYRLETDQYLESKKMILLK